MLADFIVSVEFAALPGVRDLDVGANVELRPEMFDVLNVTVPLKPRLLTVIIAVADFPASKEDGDVKVAVRV